MSQVKSKEQLVEILRSDLATKDHRAIHALIVLRKYQTDDEQKTGEVRNHNGVGFTVYDSQFLTSMYESYIKYHCLSDKQIGALRKVLVKYAHQLIEHSLRNGYIRKVDGYYVW